MTIYEIQVAIAMLPRDQYGFLREWLESHDTDRLRQEMAEDDANGKRGGEYKRLALNTVVRYSGVDR